MVPAVVTISYINYAIVAVLGGIMAINGMTDVGSLASYLVFVRQAAMPINQFTQQTNFLLAALAGAERVFEVMDQPGEVDEGRTVLVNVKERADGCSLRGKTGAGPGGGRTVPDPLRGDVRFEHVDFGYEDGHPILKDISLYAEPGQKIAFVGSTGAGKTTITNLINRFYDVQGGRVIYDGIDVRDIKKDDLRRSLGIVLQDTHLFTGTIADNIRFGSWTPPGRRLRGRPHRQRRLLHPPPAPGIRHAGHRRRRQPVPGPAAAAGHRPGRRGRSAGADPGRGHLLHRHPHRGPH